MNILITGANRGLGLEMAKQSLAAGHHVIGTARDIAAASELHETEAHVLPLDVSDVTSVEALSMALIDQPIDVLINNAGVFMGRDIPGVFDLSAAELVETYRVNAVGPWMVTRALSSNVAASDRKLIVNITSMMGSCGMATNDNASKHGAYRASKSGLNMLHILMANELGERGITAVAMHPGWVQTDMGGGDAPLQIPDAVGRILKTAHSVTPDQSGAFLDLDGKTLPW